MYKIAISQRQGKNSQYKTTEKVRIHGNFLELQLGGTTKYISLNGVEEITESEIEDEGEPEEMKSGG